MAVPVQGACELEKYRLPDFLARLAAGVIFLLTFVFVFAFVFHS